MHPLMYEYTYSQHNISSESQWAEMSLFLVIEKCFDTSYLSNVCAHAVLIHYCGKFWSRFVNQRIRSHYFTWDPEGWGGILRLEIPIKNSIVGTDWSFDHINVILLKREEKKMKLLLTSSVSIRRSRWTKNPNCYVQRLSIKTKHNLSRSHNATNKLMRFFLNT